MNFLHHNVSDRCLPLLAPMNCLAERLKSLYCMAMQLEVDFFSAQPGTPPARE
jgi:hypothetical protein